MANWKNTQDKIKSIYNKLHKCFGDRDTSLALIKKMKNNQSQKRETPRCML